MGQLRSPHRRGRNERVARARACWRLAACFAGQSRDARLLRHPSGIVRDGRALPRRRSVDRPAAHLPPWRGLSHSAPAHRHSFEPGARHRHRPRAEYWRRHRRDTACRLRACAKIRARTQPRPHGRLCGTGRRGRHPARHRRAASNALGDARLRCRGSARRDPRSARSPRAAARHGPPWRVALSRSERWWHGCRHRAGQRATPFPASIYPGRLQFRRLDEFAPLYALARTAAAHHPSRRTAFRTGHRARHRHHRRQPSAISWTETAGLCGTAPCRRAGRAAVRGQCRRDHRLAPRPARERWTPRVTTQPGTLRPDHP
jgi:hypothetical protein